MHLIAGTGSSAARFVAATANADACCFTAAGDAAVRFVAATDYGAMRFVAVAGT